jgi:hypothetical protein
MTGWSTKQGPDAKEEGRTRRAFGDTQLASSLFGTLGACGGGGGSLFGLLLLSKGKSEAPAPVSVTPRTPTPTPKGSAAA